MKGILVVDKPSGPTSHDICQYFKKQLNVKKVGHAGTLDPLATGVLIILLDEATKLQSIFLGKDKEYEFTMKLGLETDTYDSQGKIVATKEVPPDALEKIKELLPEFTGEILQIPPVYSALKQHGKPLYKLAREGKEVTVTPRKITIHSLDLITTGYLLPYGNDGYVTLKTRCSSGTYVRSLAHDIGEKLGCGAHITALRRLRSEPFGLEDAIDFGKT
ncbi:MAG: tRNA pseudouridine(55) synthase TruB [Deltaproteobacteria bacterium RIFCSPLOWO2_12_FULL_44_12]|nr:MAG: tRNA pseudouridine(55) synthase TruB [Deltaproteobacteria bacterium RIFCSPHIGHO2_01_FULL_43_49]OGQ14227.1 MAG: tRNA pseudouridine(55) synthase TruB [Deltaproteobacteria bacterium RIFCSPHIGHO2_02_FULL_44_53]OGQ27443.1 MAG: tRNA pseudouridine(55) synthase TruB [Deltaproteobacteria bacterium RIFCSPHIGHO2_12_FULL_44_21]OGQ30691.1 MAG: tRNA pseudouridine(55) synthase TruB [Deltaproteobacteria bacterium RIFCSPLOWO2_01_FULL_45_74]OGQ42368.1 MAG: tRNA pseudouridine(55) synthase TruB [Deltaprote